MGGAEHFAPHLETLIVQLLLGCVHPRLPVVGNEPILLHRNGPLRQDILAPAQDRRSAMLVNCVAYEGGRKLADISREQISDYLKRPDTFVWVALYEPTEAELIEMQ